MWSKGGQRYLTFLINTLGDKMEIKDVPVIRENLDVFPDKLVLLPSKREVKFKIDLVPETTPISKIPYRMAHAELKELKVQLQDLLE